ncbi:MAG: hypothetical protein OHK0022_13870 [Roseiflexaceae bacterium]
MPSLGVSRRLVGPGVLVACGGMVCVLASLGRALVAVLRGRAGSAGSAASHATGVIGERSSINCAGLGRVLR